MARELYERIFTEPVMRVYKKYGIIPISITVDYGRFVVKYSGCEGMLPKISEEFRSKLPEWVERKTMIVCVGD